MKILKNALFEREEKYRLVTSAFRFNIEYLDCLKDLNKIYLCKNSSNVLLKFSLEDSSNLISIQAETYLLEYIGPEYNDKMVLSDIEKKLTKLGINHFASQLIAKSIKESKPIDLIDFIRNHLASVNQDSSFYIDTVDSEGNENRVICN